MMKKSIIIILYCFVISLVRGAPPGTFLLPDSVIEGLVFIDKLLQTFVFPQDDISVLPVSKGIYRANETSEIYKKGVFVASMTRNSNCRASLDKWDCELCNSTLPDGVVVRTFRTHPLDATGYIVLSEKNKAIYVTIRGAATGPRNKYNNLPIDFPQQIDHPFIPGAIVFSGHFNLFLDIRDIVYNTLVDQLALHPNYSIEVLGHSSGGSVASFLTVDLFQRLPQKRKQLVGYTLGKPRVGNRAYVKYIADNGINIKRYVYGIDAATHYYALKDGYEHEGDEYWVKSYDPVDIMVCPGPYETRNCSATSEAKSLGVHLDYFGVYQGCNIQEKLTQTVPNFK